MFDFHALGYQFISDLAATGVSRKVMQLLARHSTITLTMDRYTHLEVVDLHRAVASRTTIDHSLAESQRATGTDPCALLGARQKDFPTGQNVAKRGRSLNAPEGAAALAVNACCNAELAS